MAVSRKVGIEFVVDGTSSVERAFSTVSSSATRSAEVVAEASNTQTEAVIAGRVKQIEALRASAAAYSAASASYVKGSYEQIAASKLATEAQMKFERSIGITTVGTRQLSGASRTAERDLNKSVRGALAGTGVFSKLGQSLAFASTGFIAVAVGAEVISRGISAAEQLAKAQESLGTAIEHTGGNLAVLKPQYLATAQAAARFGQSEVDALTALARATVLTGDAASAQRAYKEALVISKATGKDFNSVLIATSKGQEGVTTSLRRYGILVSSTSTGTQQFTQVMKRFGGQAAANTSASDKLGASVANFESTLGTALLPTFDRLVGRLTEWLDKMEKSGKLQKDVNGIVHAAGTVFGNLGRAIGLVDKATGSFGHTLVIIGEIWAGIKIAGWINSLGTLAAKWGLVQTAAEGAAAAEAAAGGGAAAAGGGAAAAAAKGAVAGGVAARAAPYTMAGRAALARVSFASRFARGAALGGGALLIGSSGEVQPGYTKVGSDGHVYYGFKAPGTSKMIWTKGPRLTITGDYVPIFGAKGQLAANPFQAAFNRAVAPPSKATGAPPLPPHQIKAFKLSYHEQLLQAEAALTSSTKDDVAVAKEIAARVKRLVASGRLHGDALIQALQAEAGALATIDAAAQARKQAAQAAAAAAKARASTYNIPAALQLADAKAQAYGKSETTILKKIIAAAQKAINSGGKNWQGLVAAYNVIASARSQLEQQAQQAIIPLKLQLALAKAQATGTNQDSILRKMKAALEKALKAAKGNIQNQIDIWNQIASINQQLGQSVTNSYGKYKKASLKWETQGLGLKPEQRRALEAKLSQIGPGGTHPMAGIGAAGLIIDPETGRPIGRGHHRRRGSQYPGNGTPTLNTNIELTVLLDGKNVEAVITKRQQKNNTRRPPQRRGPHAATR